MEALVNHLDLYRLPWSLCDNGISWLEPTAQCNLACDGCYRENRVEHKTFEETLHELDVFGRYRKSDALSIAGGDPLLYPHLLATIREARRRGLKPVVNTNGHALSKELLRELKDAGLAGFTFHVDSKQGRAGKWRGKSELELCALREELADMAKSIDVGCSFNATVYPDTLKDVPALVQWAEDHMDKVQVMVFILYRDVRTRAFQYFNDTEEVRLLDEGRASSGAEAAPENADADGNGIGHGNGQGGGPGNGNGNGSSNGNGNGNGNRNRGAKGKSGSTGRRTKVAAAAAPTAAPLWRNGSTTYNLDVEKYEREHITARKVVAIIQQRFPEFRPSAYLNGTQDASSFKWLLSGRIGQPGRTFGYVGPKFQEIVQTAHHIMKDRYLAYAPVWAARAAKSALLLSPLDDGLRGAAWSFLREGLGAPLAALTKPLYFQSVLIIQPIDMLPDGRMNMCDSCPDITVWKDQLVWSCRMDEQERYGKNLWAKPASTGVAVEKSASSPAAPLASA